MAGTGEHTYQQRVLESLGSAQNYIAWLALLARPYLGDNPIEIAPVRATMRRRCLPTASVVSR